MKASKPLLTLYSREYCHLCHEMLAALEVMRGEYGGNFAVNVVDVDADETLQARYDELVPVLVGQAAGETRELCRYFLDAKAVHSYLGEIGMMPVAVPVRLKPMQKTG